MMSYSNPSYPSYWYPTYTGYGYSYYGYPESYPSWPPGYDMPSPAKKATEPKPIALPEPKTSSPGTLRPVAMPRSTQPQFEFAWDKWKDTAVRYLGYLKEFSDSWEEPIQHYYGRNTGKWYFKAARATDWLYSGMYVVKNSVEGYNFPGISDNFSRLWFSAAVAGDALLFQFISNVLVPETASRLTKRIVRKALQLGLSGARKTPAFKHARILLPALASTVVMFSLSALDPLIDALIHKTYWPLINPFLKDIDAPHLDRLLNAPFPSATVQRY